MKSMTLFEYVEQMPDEKIKQVYSEYMEWESSGSLGSRTLLREVAENFYSREATVMHFEMVAKRVFQEGTRRWIESRGQK